MPDAIKKLREPAALAAVVFVGLSLLGLLISLLFPPSVDGVSASTFSERSFSESTQFLSAAFAAALAFAVYLANHAGPAAGKARLVTLIALIETAVTLVFGVVTLLAAFGVSGEGSASFSNFLEGLGGLATVAIAGWYTWLTWQQHAAQPAQAQQPGWTGGYNTQQGQYPGQPQQGQYPGQPQAPQYPGQPQPGPQTPPPGGFGWTPQAQVASTQVAATQAVDRTQLLPPVPTAPPGFAASPQPWNPAGPGTAQPGQPQPGQLPPGQGQQPGQPGPNQAQSDQQQGQQLPPGGPFSVGDWRSDS